MLNNKGFTLLELLIIIAIIGVLSTSAMVNINIAREKARLAGALKFESFLVRNFNNTMEFSYTFDEEDLSDSSNNQFDATDNGGPVIFRKAQSRECMRGSCVKIPGGSYLRSGAGVYHPRNFMLSYWTNTASIGVKVYTSNILVTHYDNKMTADVGNICSAGQTTLYSNKSPLYDKWQHIAVLYGNEDLVFYIDGHEVDRIDGITGLTCDAAESYERFWIEGNAIYDDFRYFEYDF